MCLICIEFEKHRMSINEATRALGEMRQGLPAEHVKEVEELLKNARHDKRTGNNTGGGNGNGGGRSSNGTP